MERLSKRQKQILKFLKQRMDKDFTTPLYVIKLQLWGKENRLHLKGKQLVIAGSRLPICKGGNKHFSVKRSVLNLHKKGLVDMQDEIYDGRVQPYFFLTDEGLKCVEKLTTQKEGHEGKT